MTFRISVESRNAQADGIMSLLNGGTIELRTGTQPALITDAATGTLIATLPLQNPTAPGGSNGVATATLPVSASAIAAGTIGWARVKTSGGAATIDGSVTLAGNGGDIIISILTAAVDDIVQLVSFTITAPNI